jgi:hypothetical protein
VSPRTVVTAVVIVFIGAFAFLTVATMIEHGVDVLALASLCVLVLLGVGILGALASGGPEE